MRNCKQKILSLTLAAAMLCTCVVQAVAATEMDTADKTGIFCGLKTVINNAAFIEKSLKCTFEIIKINIFCKFCAEKFRMT